MNYDGSYKLGRVRFNVSLIYSVHFFLNLLQCFTVILLYYYKKPVLLT